MRPVSRLSHLCPGLHSPPLPFPLPLPPTTTSTREPGFFLTSPTLTGTVHKKARLRCAFAVPRLCFHPSFSLPLQLLFTTCITTSFTPCPALAEHTWVSRIAVCPISNVRYRGLLSFFVLACRCPFPFPNSPDLPHIQYSSKTVTLAT